MLPDLHIGFSRGRSGGPVFPSLSEFSTVYCDLYIYRQIHTHTHTHTHTIYIYSGEENGNPLQYSCLENLMDRGTWWTTIHGVAQSQAQLKRLSSSSIQYVSVMYIICSLLYAMYYTFIIVNFYCIHVPYKLIHTHTHTYIYCQFYKNIWLYDPIARPLQKPRGVSARGVSGSQSFIGCTVDPPLL